MDAIEGANLLILVAAGLVLLGIASSRLAMRFGAPLLLIFLGLGMLAGVDGPGGVRFANVELAYLIGSIALAVILFDGGLRTKYAAVRPVLGPSLLLATLGVIITAVVVALAAHFILGLDRRESLLIGAIVSSTDAAAVFFLLNQGGLQVRRRIARTLELESGANDPIAVFAVIILTSLMADGGVSNWGEAGYMLGQQFVLGIMGGLVGGWVIAALTNRLYLPSGLHPLFVIASALTLFGLVAASGGSGFLAVYLAGLIVGNRPMRAQSEINAFHDAATWLSQIVMFLVLGLLVSPTRLLDFVWPALVIGLVLMLVARPLAVLLCLSPFRFSFREQAFISWVGLRGAVAIFLASIPWLDRLPNAGFYFNVTFFIVIMSLIIQGWTVRRSARLLGVSLRDAPQPVKRIELDLPGQLELELAGYAVDSHIATALKGRLPTWARIGLVVRKGRILLPHEVVDVLEGDTVYLLVPPGRVDILDRILTPDSTETATVPPLAFEFSADLPVRWLAEEYGLSILAVSEDQTIANWIEDNLDCAPYEGASINLAGPIDARIQVRRMIGPAVINAVLILGEGERPKKTYLSKFFGGSKDSV